MRAGGYDFQTLPPLVGPQGLEPFPDLGAKRALARASFFYFAIGVTPAMCMNLPGVGSQYLAAMVDAEEGRLAGDVHYAPAGALLAAPFGGTLLRPLP